MKRITIKELEWIHDCTLLGVSFETSNDDGRAIELVMQCPPDIGYVPWNGRALNLKAIKVAVSQYYMFNVVGPESVDAIRPGVSAALLESIAWLGQKSGRTSTLEFTVAFHSGSFLEIICRDLHLWLP